jgi:uncharacterized protein
MSGELPDTLAIDCRRCGASMKVDRREPLPGYFPFCSDRCRLIDLGKWFDEDFKIERDIEQSDLEQLD